jgi:hypothetical protein
MSDSFGGLTLPASLSGAGLADADLGKADPTANTLLSYFVAVVRAQLNAEWGALRPRPAGDTEGANVVRKSAVANPEKGQFAADDLPALWLWRARGRQQDATFGYRTEDATLQVFWGLPVDRDNKATLRAPFGNAVMKAIGAALRDNRHPSWWHPADTDPKAPTRAADDDAIVLPRATSTLPVTLSGVGLDGVVGGATLNPRRGLSIETTPAPGAYNDVDPVVVTYLDWLDIERTAEFLLTEDGGDAILYAGGEAKAVVRVEIPAQQLTTGEIRVGLQGRAGRGSSITQFAQLMRVELTDWSPHTISIDVMASDGRAERTPKYYGVLGTIQAAEQYERDPSARAWPIATPTAGLDFAVSIDGEIVTSASLPDAG